MKVIFFKGFSLKNIFKIVLCLLLYFPLLVLGQGSNKFLPQLHHAALMVEESWNILDNIVDEVWPGWDCYKDESYFTVIVGKQDLLINPPGKPGKGFRLQADAIQGKAVYLRTPGKVEKIWGGAYRYKIGRKRYKAAQFHPYSEEYSARVAESAKLRYGFLADSMDYSKIYHSTEFYIAMTIHEAFHLFQRKMNKKKIANASHPSPFFGNETHDLLLALEGRILSAAFLCKNRKKCIDLARQFLAVRQERRKTLTEDDILWEHRNEFMEGMAQYVETKVWLLLSDMVYKTEILSDDPHYNNFDSGQDKRALVSLIIEKSGLPVTDDNQVSIRCYYFGLAQAFVLDRLCGHEWKKNFFADGAYFETELEKYCGFEKEDGPVYLEKAKEQFGGISVLND